VKLAGPYLTSDDLPTLPGLTHRESLLSPFSLDVVEDRFEPFVPNPNTRPIFLLNALPDIQGDAHATMALTPSISGPADSLSLSDHPYL